MVSRNNPASATAATAKKERPKKNAKPGRVGRPPKVARAGIESVVDGDTASARAGPTKAGGTSTHNGQDGNDAANDEEEDGEDEEGGEEGGGTQMEGGVRLTKAAVDQDKANRATFLLMMEKMNREHADQFGLWNQIHLNKNVVRRLTNQTLSQSVPVSVVNAIAAYTKLFAGEIVDRARGVQKEWVAAAEKLPTGDKNEEGFGKDGEGEPKVRERDRGPLLPDHMREALRRYKLSREGGAVGFTGLSLEGKETVAVRNGGKRLFR